METLQSSSSSSGELEESSAEPVIPPSLDNQSLLTLPDGGPQREANGAEADEHETSFRTTNSAVVSPERSAPHRPPAQATPFAPEVSAASPLTLTTPSTARTTSRVSPTQKQLVATVITPSTTVVNSPNKQQQHSEKSDDANPSSYTESAQSLIRKILLILESLSPRRIAAKARDELSLPFAFAAAVFSVLALLVEFVAQVALIWLQAWWTLARFVVVEVPVNAIHQIARSAQGVCLSCIVFFLSKTPGGPTLLRSLNENVSR